MNIVSSVLLLAFLSQVFSQNSISITCPFAHFRTKSGDCVECLTKCSRCQNLEGNCQGCSQGYNINFDASQCEACEFGKLRCSRNGIISCQRFYTPLNGMCLPICQDENCQNCQSIIATTCDGCKKGFRLNSQNRCITENNMLRINSIPRQLQQKQLSDKQKQRLFSLIGLPTAPKTSLPPLDFIKPQQIFRSLNIDPSTLNLSKPIFQPTNLTIATPISTQNLIFQSKSEPTTVSSNLSNNTGSLVSSNEGSIAINPITVAPVTLDNNVALDSNFNPQTVNILNVNNQKIMTSQQPSNVVLPSQPSDIVALPSISSQSSLAIQPSNIFLPSSQPSNVVLPTQPSNLVLPTFSSGSSIEGFDLNAGSSSTSGGSGGFSTTTTSVAPIGPANNNSLVDGISIITKQITVTSNSTIIQNNSITILPIKPSSSFVPIIAPQTITTNVSIMANESSNFPSITPIVPSVPISTIPTNCKIGQFSNRQGICQACSQRCLTCINSQIQCLQCNFKYIKLGWKCIYNESVGFDISLKALPQQHNYIVNEGINLIKSNFLRFILPQQYREQNISVISLTSLIYDQSKKLLNLTGIVEKTPKIGIAELQSNISSNLNTTFSNFWPAGFIYNGLMYYNGSSGVLSSISESKSPNITVFNQTNLSNQTTDEVPTNNGPNLVAILIPSIIGGLCLFAMLTTLLCWLCKFCCFKKPASALVPNTNQNIDTQRIMNNNVAMNKGNPLINNVPAVPTPPTVSIIQPGPIISQQGGVKQLIIKNPITNNHFSNTSIDRNIIYNQGQVIQPANYVFGNKIQQTVQTVQNKIETFPQIITYNTTNQQIPINIQTTGNNVNTLTNVTRVNKNNNIPMLQSKIGVNGSKNVTTTISQYERQQKLNNNEIIVSRDIKVVEYTKPFVQEHAVTNTYGYNNSAAYSNNAGYFQQYPETYNNIGTPTNIGSRIAINDISSPSSGSGYNGNQGKYSFNRDQNQIMSEKIENNMKESQTRTMNIYGNSTYRQN